MKSYLAACTAVAFMFGLSACSVNPATGKQSFTGLMSPEKEVQVGQEEHPKVLQQFGGAYDFKTLQIYVNDLGQKLAAVSEMPNLRWTFTILDDPIINAFALPGGYIYISRGLIALAENEAEVAAVLGHEIAHVTARHTAQRYSQSVLTGLGATVLGIVVGGPAGDLANFAGQAYLASYSREHEMEADQIGIRYMTKLGYDPKASASFFRKLAEHTELSARLKGHEHEQGHYNIFASHPDTRLRIQASEKLAQSYGPENDRIARSSFLSQINGLDYGPSVRQGVIEGQAFLHPELRFKFEAPEGFELVNAPAYVAAVHPNKSAMIFDMGPAKHANMAMVRYIDQVWAAKYNPRDLQAITVNGMAGATGVIQLRTNQGVRDIRYVAIQDQGQIFQFRFLSPPELSSAMELPFRRATYSFERLSIQQAQAIRSQKIGLVRVNRGETVFSLAQKMKVDKGPEDWFKVLNREALSDGLQAGETMKIVTH